MVRFVKTGSEACAAAVRLARAATGREKILVASGGYHGWHDWFLVTCPAHAGVPEGLRAWIEEFAFGDLDDADRRLHRRVRTRWPP